DPPKRNPAFRIQRSERSNVHRGLAHLNRSLSEIRLAIRKLSRKKIEQFRRALFQRGHRGRRRAIPPRRQKQWRAILQNRLLAQKLRREFAILQRWQTRERIIRLL